MGFDFEENKTLLYADLFKPREIRESSSVIMPPQWRSPSSSAYDSSSSGFSTPFGSEMGSSESDGGADFAAELSRQMAELMLHEEEEKEEVEENKPVCKYGFNMNRPVLHHANRTPCSKNDVSRGRKVKVAELTQTQQMQTRKAGRNHGRCRVGEWRTNGSGMRAIFLGRPGSRSGSCGTGVYLPQVTSNPVKQKKKSGLSTVLIPIRVLQALELHFTSLSDSAATSLMAGYSCHTSPRDKGTRSKGKGHIEKKFETEKINMVDEMQLLPQEWSY